MGKFWLLTQWCGVPTKPGLDFFSLLQTPTLQHYMGYSEDGLVPVMQHIAKNVVKVNAGQTKHMVSEACNAAVVSCW